MGKGPGDLRGGGKWLEPPHLPDHPKGSPGFRLGGAWDSGTEKGLWARRELLVLSVAGTAQGPGLTTGEDGVKERDQASWPFSLSCSVGEGGQSH